MDIEIRGLAELQEKLGRIATSSFLVSPMQGAVTLLQDEMKRYPPQPARSTYRRTGTLGRRWTTKVTQTGGELQGRVGNNTEYGPWVQSEQFQARTHRGRWQTDERVLRDNEGRITEMFQKAVEAMLRAK
jgi:hypothetical protein